MHTDMQSSRNVDGAIAHINSPSSLSDFSLLIENNPLLSAEQKHAMLATLNHASMTHSEQASLIAASDETIGTMDVDVVTPDVTTQPTLPDVQEVAKSADEKTEGSKGTGKGKSTRGKRVITPEQKTRMTSLMDFIDSLLQEVTGEPDEGLDRKTQVGQDAIYTLLFNNKKGEQRIIPSRVKRVFTDMWNEPRNPRSGYWLRNNLSYNKFCEEFEKRIHGIIAEENKGKAPTDITAWRKPSQHSDDPKVAATPGAQYILDAINEASEANIANFNEADYLAAMAL